jgi:Cu-processing system permease protein
MKGMGLILGLWLYLVLIHDGFLLLVLIAFKDYSLDILSGWLGVMNPLGLARVLMMLVLDGALLLGQVSAVVRNALSGNTIYIVGTLVFLVWVFVPLALSLKLMKNRDF